MYSPTPVFWVEPTGLTARGARRYVGRPGKNAPLCADGASVHAAITWVDEVDTVLKLDLDDTRVRREVEHLDPAADYWPTRCERCTMPFGDDVVHQTFSQEIYRRYDGRLYVLPSYAGTSPPNTTRMPPGAMYDAYWYPEQWRGEDGIALCVVLPNGREWCVDSPASNCTRPGEEHKCWVRKGDPRLGDVTVDKNGNTCAAGAGSILAGDYHGFLRDGTLSAG